MTVLDSLVLFTPMTMNNPFLDISHRGFQLALQDLRDLRTRYARTFHVPFYRISLLKRPFIVGKLLELEFGDRYTEYEKCCRVWRKMDQEAVNIWLKSADLDTTQHA